MAIPPAKEAGKHTCLVSNFVTSNNIRKIHWPPLVEALTLWDVSDLLVQVFMSSLHQSYNGLTLTHCASLIGARGFNQHLGSILPPTLLASFPIALPFFPLLWPKAQVLITPDPLTLFHIILRGESITLLLYDRNFLLIRGKRGQGGRMNTVEKDVS